MTVFLRTIGFCVLVSTAYSQSATVDILQGDGNGIRFWQDNSYKVHMGTGSEYHYGPVSSYSIRMNMSGHSDRGWTWGVVNQVPIAALNTLGEMQIAGSFDAHGQLKVGGVGVITNGGNDVWGNIRVLRSSSTIGDGMYIGYGGAGGPIRFFSNQGTTEHMTLATNGSLGLGATSPEAKLDIDFASVADQNRPSLLLRNSAANQNYSGMLGFKSSATTSPFYIYTWNNELQFSQRTPDGGWKSHFMIFDNTNGHVTFTNATGNVGVGTATPENKLHVVGAENFFKARFQGPDGYIDIGPGNALWGHIYTDRPNFIFNKNVWSITGGFSSYTSTDLTLQTNGVSRLVIAHASGNVGIGTASPTQKLTVAGAIYGKEVKVDLNVPGPDYVFEQDYKLTPLSEVESYVKSNKHLPEVPSAEEMKRDGINVSEMNIILLKKVEELTLHLIQQQKEIQAQRAEIENLKSKIR